MSGFDHSVLTNVGWEALTDAEAGQHIEYIHLEAGDGVITGGDAEMYTMTALKHKIMDFPINSFSNDGQGQITLIGALSSKNVADGFFFREIGVKATIDGGPELLYAVANAGDLADWVPPSTDTGIVIQSVQIIIRIDRAENVTVVIVPGLDVTAQNIGPGTVGPGWFRDKTGQILWFKRAVQGKIMRLVETADTVLIENTGADTALNIGDPSAGAGIFKSKDDGTGVLNLRRLFSPLGTMLLAESNGQVTIDTKKIVVDLNMSVFLGAPDVFPNFSTIQKAVDYLKPYSFDTGISITISVAAGVWVNSDTINISHPNGQQIRIIGTTSAAKTVTNVSSAGGASVRLNAPVGRFTGIVAGDFIYFQNTSSISGMAISGIWEVISVASDGSNLVYSIATWASAMPPLGGISGGTVQHLQTVLRFAANKDGITIRGDGLGLLRMMALRGSSTNTLINGLSALQGVTTCEYVGAIYWNSVTLDASHTGFTPSGGATLFLTNCSANRGRDGFWAGHPGATLQCQTCFTNSNEHNGSWTNGGALNGNILVACGNGSAGFVSTTFAGMILTNCFGCHNRDYGMRCTNGSQIEMGPTSSGSFINNGALDIFLSVLSAVIRGAGTPINYGSVNIAPNSLSASGCFFSPT